MTYITLAHGNGGHYMRQLIEEVFSSKLKNDVLDNSLDAVRLPSVDGELMMSVDGFTVQPLIFPGGDIGSLSVHGTVNDLAVGGATPRFLSLSVIIEEGLELAVLEQIIDSMANAAQQCGVQIVCGDTKVVPRGQGSGMYITTTGLGVRQPDINLAMDSIRSGDRILLSGSIGDHGTCVLLAREQFGLKGEILSDSASVLPLCSAIRELDGLRFMRDPTRGGLATVLHEMQHLTSLGIKVREQAIPVKDPVNSVCEILGYDPMYLACEGRVLAVVAAEQAEAALARWKALPEGMDAAIIGEFSSKLNCVVLETTLGGQRVLHELEDDPLPRIC